MLNMARPVLYFHHLGDTLVRYVDNKDPNKVCHIRGHLFGGILTSFAATTKKGKTRYN